MIDLIHIAVHYRSSAAVRAFVNQFTLDPGVRHRILVVDNGSDEADKLALKSLAAGDDRVTVISAPTNLGYFGGVRYALDKYDGINAADWFLISNCDLRFMSGRLAQSLRFAQSRHEVAIAPRICSRRTGAEQNPYLVRRLSILRAVRTMILFTRPSIVSVTRRASAYRRRRSVAEADVRLRRPIWAPHGSCIFLHRNFFEAGGNLDWPMFLFGEEVHIGMELERLGLMAAYEPALMFEHDEHVSVGQVEQSAVVYASQRASTRAVVKLLVRAAWKRPVTRLHQLRMCSAR